MPEFPEIPAHATLESTPEVLRALLSALTEAQTYWKPAPDRWCVAEILEHLSHVEAHCFRHRAEAIVSQDHPTFEPYDQEAYAAAGQYSGRDAEDSFDHFEEQREDNVEWLTGLTPAEAARKGHHTLKGDITLLEILNAWAFHDLGHIRQIAEIVRAAAYLPAMGPFAHGEAVHP